LIHVGIVGAGALGLGYAAALASAGARITLISRRKIAGRFTIARRFARERELQLHVSDALVPCDVLFVTLRAEDVVDSLLSALSAAKVPVVLLSPLVSEAELQRWRTLPGLVAGAPSLVAALHGTRLEYWVPPLQATTLDDVGKAQPAVVMLRRLLQRGGVPTQFRAHGLELSRATTLAFFPLQRALLARPALGEWRHDSAWCRRLARGFRISRRVALELHAMDLAPRLATRILATPQGVWLTSLLLSVCVPSLAAFLGDHFGRKLKAQTTMFGESLRKEAALYRLTPEELDALELLGPGA
jgi:hypothetical protein